MEIRQQKRRGRPPIENPLVKRGVRFHKDQLEALNYLADIEGKDFSRLVRAAVDEYLVRADAVHAAN